MITSLDIARGIICPACEKKGQHDTVFARDHIEHLRCIGCGAIGAFIVEESEETAGGFVKRTIVHQDYTALMERRGSQSFRKYSIGGSFTDGQYLKHKNFGKGYILAMMTPPSKMHVLFEDKMRVLLCGTGSKRGGIKRTPPKREKKEPKAEPVADDSGNENPDTDTTKKKD